MLLRRLEVFLIVLLLVTVGYHLFKDTVTSDRIRLPLPSLPPLRSPVPPLLLHSDPTLLYAFHPIGISSVANGSLRPLQQLVSRRNRRRHRFLRPRQSLFYPPPF